MHISKTQMSRHPKTMNISKSLSMKMRMEGHCEAEISKYLGIDASDVSHYIQSACNDMSVSEYIARHWIEIVNIIKAAVANDQERLLAFTDHLAETLESEGKPRMKQTHTRNHRSPASIRQSQSRFKSSAKCLTMNSWGCSASMNREQHSPNAESIATPYGANGRTNQPSVS